MLKASLYLISEASERNKLDVAAMGDFSLPKKYDILWTMELSGKTYLFGYAQADLKTDAFIMSTEMPFLTPVESSLDLSDKAWDFIEPFTIGNKPHLMCYEAKTGWFYFFPFDDKTLTTKECLHFYHPRVPVTQNFTMVKVLVALGGVFFIGYDHAVGTINAWMLSVTATSEKGKPPLLVVPVWDHQWAKGWTRFAFMEWGGENFFLKTNDWKPNVNIDHLDNVLSQGSNEVGSRLHLDDAQDLTIVHPLQMQYEEPYFTTYLPKGGQVRLYRVHANCQGWTQVASFNGSTTASKIVSTKIGNQTALLVVG